MKRTFSILICAFALITALSCSKHNGDVEEQLPTATLTFASPTQGAVYQAGDSVRIQALATATGEMHGYTVSVCNAADTAVVYFSQQVHAHGDTLLINHAWKDTLTTTANLQVAVTLTLDHEGHTSYQSVNIKTEN